MADQPLRTRVKICCITTPEALALAVRHGADALGLVGPMPSGTGIIDLATARGLAALAPPGVATFLLSCATDAATLIEQARVTACSTLQIVDRVPAGTYAELRRALPALKLVQVIHVEDESALDEAERRRPRSTPSCSTAAAGRVPSWSWAARVACTTGPSAAGSWSGCAGPCSWPGDCGRTMWRRRSGRSAPMASTSAPACAPRAGSTARRSPASWPRSRAPRGRDAYQLKLRIT